jgi:hypothetical protein
MLPDKNIYMVFINRKGVSVYIGEFTLERIKNLKWKMIFEADQIFQPQIKKKVFESKATGFSRTFPLNEDNSALLNLCKSEINDFIETNEIIELHLR